MNMLNVFRRLSTVILACLYIAPIFLLVVAFASYGKVHETENVDDYGRIVGNFNNNKPAEFIFSFFPENICSNFEDITYHYKAVKGDEYAYECYLEFVIKDKNEYNRFLASCVDAEKTQYFRYDQTFMEYSVSDVLNIDWTFPTSKEGYPINYAEIGKILFSDSEQRLMFFALGMWDGGGTYTSELNYFFKKYNIDVIEYQLNAYYSHADQANGITYEKRYELGGPTPYPYPS